MTRRRWIADKVSGNHAALTDSHADHLVRVLRARIGQEFDIVADGVVRRGRIVSIVDGRVDFELGEELPKLASTQVALLLAIFKFDRMEWAIEKATELGVSRIIPMVARRTDAHLASAAAKRVGRWHKIALQAAEQSRRTSPPEIEIPIPLREAVRLPAAVRIVLSEREERIQLRDALAERDVKSEVLLAIGPEGGWTEDELQLFQKDGWVAASLGSTVLRAETAAIAAVVLAMN